MTIINPHIKDPKKSLAYKLKARRYIVNPPGFKRVWSDWTGIFEGAWLPADKITFLDKHGNKIEADLKDANSPYFGISVYNIIKAYNERKSIPGKIYKAAYSRNGEFKGYEVRIGNIITFMPLRYTKKELKNPEKIELHPELRTVDVKIIEIDPKKYNVIVSSIY